ncbi:hypothetical protein [Aromatoleum petrolei]|uniref:Uncharacterized protein n=1 Tax=Aromatoleum petrolei TaxID=76116 RepID=A0ABX1MH18_9RHOO|nr:hypothetical protein [Aromatoleum petrolei]NMF87078.1 hypothetical protein [Aromatoleum petrolei]QTQ34815.1 Uncharacterized protein ToN1_06390 [Aromatoleum petrolei]
MTRTASDFPNDAIIRISNLDVPIYRIFPVWHLEEAVRLRRAVLVPPRRWDDPFEVVGNAISVDCQDGPEIINQSLPQAYAQCWSLTEESDTLLRAYSRVVKDALFGRNTSPRDEGVRVRSTPRKLLGALKRGTPVGLTGEWFLGAVKYVGRTELLQELANAIGAHGKRVFYYPANHAKLLLLKRSAFSHEAEVRAIFVQHDTDQDHDLLSIPLDPNEVFDEITFDPRLQTSERKEREAVLRSLGYSGSFGESELYHRTLLQVVVSSPPKE